MVLAPTYGGGIPSTASGGDLSGLPSFPVAAGVLVLLLAVLAGLTVIVGAPGGLGCDDAGGGGRRWWR